MYVFCFYFPGMYFASSMTLVALSCFMTVMVLNIHFRGNNGRKVPRWVKYIVVDKLGFFVCSRKNTERFYRSHNSAKRNSTKINPEKGFEVRKLQCYGGRKDNIFFHQKLQS